MKLTLVYPPVAYPYMPAMGIYALKGYVESVSAIPVECVDLNAYYHNDCWSGAALDSFEAEIERLPRELRILAAAVRLHGRSAVRALRQRCTYEAGYETVRSYASLLSAAMKVVKALDLSVGCTHPQRPTELDGWRDVVDSYDNSIVGNFLRKWVESRTWCSGDAIGISLTYLEQIPIGLFLARLVKTACNGCQIVFGGSALTHILHDALRDASFWQNVDYGIPYEGEYSLVQLLRALTSGESTDTIDNIVTWRRGSALHYQKDLKGRPKTALLPNFDDLDPELFPTPEPIYPLLTSKGCYWGKCAFCTHHEGYGQGYFPFADAIFEQALDILHKRGAKAAYFVDEALPPKMVYQFAKRMTEKCGGAEADFRWMAELRLEKTCVTQEYVSALAVSGCTFAINGMESGSQRVVDLMRKGVDLSLAPTFAALCREYGIKVGWMFFVGFPTETDEEIQQTFDLIRANQQNLAAATIGTFGLERDSPVWIQPSIFGVDCIERDARPYQVNFSYVVAGKRALRPELESTLRRFYDKNSDVLPILSRVVDRAFAFFMPTEIGGATEVHFDTPFEGRIARYRPTMGNIELLKSS